MAGYKLSEPIFISGRVTKLLCNHKLITVCKISKGVYNFIGVEYFTPNEQEFIKAEIMEKISNARSSKKAKKNSK
jgi:hypothetical protein